MSLLRLEELESRQLLSASYAAPPPRPSPADNPPMWIGTQPRAGDFGSPGRIDLSEGFARPDFGTGRQPYDAGSPLVIEWIVISINLPEHDTPSNGSYTSGSVNTPAANPKSITTDAGSITAVADVASPRAATLAPARTNVQSPFTMVAPVTLPAVVAEIQGPTSVPLSARSIRLGDSMAPTGPAWLTQGATATAAPTPTPITEESEPAEGKPIESALPGVFAALPTMDLASLGHDLQQFLARMERAGEELVGDGDGLRPWLVAGAAAATACEIARRQWARSQRSAINDQRSVRPVWLIVDR